MTTGKAKAETQGEAVDADLEGFIGYNLKRAYVAVQADFRASLGEDGLGPRDFSALALVTQFPQITQSALARMLGIERSGLVAITDALEKRGYLNRVPVPDDRRVQALVATPAGQGAYAAALAAVRAHEARLFSGLSAAEQRQLLTLLRKFRDTLGDDG